MPRCFGQVANSAPDAIGSQSADPPIPLIYVSIVPTMQVEWSIGAALQKRDERAQCRWLVTTARKIEVKRFQGSRPCGQDP